MTLTRSFSAGKQWPCRHLWFLFLSSDLFSLDFWFFRFLLILQSFRKCCHYAFWLIDVNIPLCVLGKFGQQKEQWNGVNENWFPAKSLLSPIRPGSNDTHTSELTLNSIPLLFCLASLSRSNTVLCISCVTWHYTLNANFQIIIS